jgi:hypothetical protein
MVVLENMSTAAENTGGKEFKEGKFQSPVPKTDICWTH